MPKQRLVDFRGGQNNKISPHMIGDTQGQSAVNVDLSAVRLQGRNALDGDAAAGTFYYEVTGGGSWVSTDSQDSSHIDHAVDFAIWNQDLYVAMGVTSSNGILQVYRDGNLSSPQLLSFNPPGASSSVTPSYATNTLLVEETEEQEFIPITYEKTPVTTYNAQGPWDSEGYTFSPAFNSHFDTGAKITYYEWKRGGSPGYWSESAHYHSNEAFAKPILTRSGTAGIPESSGVEVTTVVTNGYVPNGETIDIGGATYYVWAKTGSADLVAVQNTSTPEVNLYNNTSYSTALTSTDPDGYTFSGDYRLCWNADTQQVNQYQLWQKTGSQDLLKLNIGGYPHLKTIIADTELTNTPFDSTSAYWYFQKAVTNRVRTVDVTKSTSYSYWRVKTDQTKFEIKFEFYYMDLKGNTNTDSDYVGVYSIGSSTTYTSGTSLPAALIVIPSTANALYFEPASPNSGNALLTLDGEFSKQNYSHTSNGWDYYQIRFKGDINYADIPSYTKMRTPYASPGEQEVFILGDTAESSILYKGKEYFSNETSGGLSLWYLSADTVATGLRHRDMDQPGDTAYRTAYSLGDKATFTKQAVPDNYTYTQFEDNLRVDGQPFISATPEFYRDQARYYLYRESTAEDLVASESDWEIDPARESSSGGWLGDGAAKRTITGDIEGYYAKTARNQNNIPVLSQEVTRLAPTSSFDTDLVFSPRRLNFSFQTPSDNSTAGVPALVGYYLSRIDSISTVALGYVNPDRGVTLTHQSPDKLQLTGLGSGPYRIKFYCYQGAQLAVGTSSFDKFNLDGVAVGNNQYLTIASGPQVPESWAVDIWIEKRALISASGLETWVTAQCFEVFAFDGAVSVNKCDFLDIFPNGISSGALAFAEEQQSPPEYLKFIRQSNNFFFAVGTTKTPEIRYGYNSNKADSYLFVSRFNNPRDWPLDGYVEFEDSITGLFAYSGELIVWTQHGTYRVFGSAHNQMRKVKLATTEGMVSGDHKSAALVRGYLVWMSSSGICVYDGSSVTNITEGRFETFTKLGGAHAGQVDGVYYLCNSQEQGYSVDFNLPGFPITEVNLKEDKSGTVTSPVLVYRSATNRLYSRRGQVAANASRTVWAYKTRAFDGGEFGRNKLVHSIELNGSNQSTGVVQILLDGVPVYTSTVTLPGYPITIYLPPNSIGDVWSVSLTSWRGVVDYISTEYQVL